MNIHIAVHLNCLDLWKKLMIHECIKGKTLKYSVLQYCVFISEQFFSN